MNDTLQYPTEVALDRRCDECNNRIARGDATKIGYCEWCGREYHPEDDDYPQVWVLTRVHEGR